MHDVTKNERELTKNMALAVEKNDHSLLFACVIVENGAKAVERWIGLERLRSSLAFSLVLRVLRRAHDKWTQFGP